MPDPLQLELQFRTLYRLYYKRNEREAFLRKGEPPVRGLAARELAQLKAVEPARLRRVVELHAGDIGAGWYRPRVPATWLALQAVLEVPEDELVHRLTESAGFESRVNDDSDAAALAAFVDGLSNELRQTPWMADLLRHERLVGCPWPSGPNPRLVRFDYDVGGIREALLVQGLCPTDERKHATHLLLFRGPAGVNELAVKPRDAEVLAALIEGRKPDAAPRVVERCRAMLREVRQG